ncbi:class I SAM-dependent methyltransferase [Paraburkholderia caffeinilytica]|uniref:class I SAM-dependent methyltransferase n=1 Tax=Paraburkholderia caffeinilytica TaxID=1761016 RepID=UPI003DA131C4
MQKNRDEVATLDPREARRQRVLRGLSIKDSIGIEIGALCWPIVRRENGANVVYVDHTDTVGLRQKYKDDPHVKLQEIVDVDAIWGRNSLHEAVGGKYFDYVVASHVVEHVPDLVTWLRELAAVLRPTGEIRLAVPDRRFTFDYFRKETKLQEVLASYVTRARVPQPYSLIDYCLSAADINTADAWRGRIDAQTVKRQHTSDGGIWLARDAFENGTYHDVHCWAFIPRSFARLMSDLCELGLLDLACEDFHDTAWNDIEFFVTLRRSHDKNHIAKSWLRMERAASNATPGVPFWRLRRKLEELLARSANNGPTPRPSGQSSELDPLEPLEFPPDFDPEQYLRANPDVRESGADPTLHYRHHGWREGRPIRAL